MRPKKAMRALAASKHLISSDVVVFANIHLQNENEEQPDKMLHNGGSAPKGKDN
jgi:hypothetical protein